MMSHGLPLQVRRVAGRAGAIIDGVELGPDMADDVVEAVRAALLRHKVVFFRDQAQLDDDAQEGFAARLGPLQAHPTVPAKQDGTFVLELDSLHGGRTNSWHTDVTFLPAYPAFSVLRAVKIPQVGGDTIWANTATAYDDLPDALKREVDGMWAIHSNDFDYARASVVVEGEEGHGAGQSLLTSTLFETRHPLVRVHPETGERSLVLGHFLKAIEGCGREESRSLFRHLQAYVTRPENSVRWQWAAGDVAIWDNRATQHYAIHDYDERRIMRRVTIGGDAPTAVDGSRSVQVRPIGKD